MDRAGSCLLWKADAGHHVDSLQLLGAPLFISCSLLICIRMPMQDGLVIVTNGGQGGQLPSVEDRGHALNGSSYPSLGNGLHAPGMISVLVIYFQAQLKTFTSSISCLLSRRGGEAMSINLAVDSGPHVPGVSLPGCPAQHLHMATCRAITLAQRLLIYF